MKVIAIVTPAHWSQVTGGSELQIRYLLDHLISLDSYKIYYVTKSVGEDFSPNGYVIERLPELSRYKISVLNYMGDFADSPALYKTLKKIKPDVIYQRVGGIYTGVSACYARHHGAKMVWHISSDMNVTPFRKDMNKARNIVNRFVAKKFLEYGIKNCDAIIAQTKQQDDLLFRHYSRKADRIIANFHEPPVSFPLANENKLVLWISNIKKLKRPELFIELARSQLSRKDIEFVMIGRLDNSPWSAQIKEMVGATGNLRMTGEISHQEVNEWLHKASLVVNTSMFEGMPNSFIQAWLRKIPVLTMGVDPDNVIKNEGIGAVADDMAGMTENLVKILDDSGLRIAMGRKARDFAITTYSKDNVKEIGQIIHSLILRK